MFVERSGDEVNLDCGSTKSQRQQARPDVGLARKLGGAESREFCLAYISELSSILDCYFNHSHLLSPGMRPLSGDCVPFPMFDLHRVRLADHAPALTIRHLHLPFLGHARTDLGRSHYLHFLRCLLAPAGAAGSRFLVKICHRNPLHHLLRYSVARST